MSPFARLLLSPPACRNLTALRAALGGQTVLITGASFGIGEATARLFAQAGAEVLVVARTGERLHELVADIERTGGRAFAYPLDLSCPDDIPLLVDRLVRRHPRIAVVVSNAGRSIRRPAVRALDRRDLERSVAVNFTGPAALLLGLLPHMIAAGGGQIINVSTVSVKPPAAPRWASYQGSKAGFDLWLRSVAAEVQLDGVRVSSVYMPLVRTRMSAAGGLYRHAPALTPLEAAQVLAGAVVRPRARVAPWWLSAQEAAAFLLPGVTDWALARLEARERLRGARRGAA